MQIPEDYMRAMQDFRQWLLGMGYDDYRIEINSRGVFAMCREPIRTRKLGGDRR